MDYPVPELCDMCWREKENKIPLKNGKRCMFSPCGRECNLRITAECGHEINALKYGVCEGADKCPDFKPRSWWQ